MSTGSKKALMNVAETQWRRGWGAERKAKGAEVRAMNGRVEEGQKGEGMEERTGEEKIRYYYYEKIYNQVTIKISNKLLLSSNAISDFAQLKSCLSIFFY